MFPPPIPRHRSSQSEDDLIPDPLFMAVRSMITTGPIGWIQSRLSAWSDAREARRESAAAIVTATDLVRSVTPVASLARRDDPPTDLAA